MKTMLKVKIQWKWIGKQEEKQLFEVFLQTTDGMQLIFATTNFGELADRIGHLQKAIPQITTDDIEFMRKSS